MLVYQTVRKSQQATPSRSGIVPHRVRLSVNSWLQRSLLTAEPVVESLNANHRGYSFDHLPIQAPLSLEGEAESVANRVVHDKNPGPIAIRGKAPHASVQKQEHNKRPRVPPSVTDFPGQTAESAEEEKKKKVEEGFKKLGEGLAKKAVSDAEKIPGVKEVYTAVEELFKIPAVMALAGIGYSAAAATVIVKNASDREAQGIPGSFPIEETQFGLRGGFDVTKGLSDIKFVTPIGDLPPSLGSKAPPATPSPLFQPPSLVMKEDLIGRRLRKAREQAQINSWVVSQQGLILRPLEESRRKKEARKPSPHSVIDPLFKRKPGAPALPAGGQRVADTGRRSGGQALEPEVKQSMERRFGFDFSRVQIHRDSTATAASRALDAEAYTMGNDIIFGAGQYRPTTFEGRLLLAHELTHVVQQSRHVPAPK